MSTTDDAKRKATELVRAVRTALAGYQVSLPPAQGPDEVRGDAIDEAKARLDAAHDAWRAHWSAGADPREHD